MIVVAGLGNVLKSDDGFGPAVVERLRTQEIPTDVTLVDAGVRTMHLAYDIADDVELLIVVDVVATDDEPGTLVVLEPDLDSLPTQPDGHGMGLAAVLDLTRRLGRGPERIVMIGCPPVSITDGLGMSPQVEAAVGPATTLVREYFEEAARP